MVVEVVRAGSSEGVPLSMQLQLHCTIPGNKQEEFMLLFMCIRR